MQDKKSARQRRGQKSRAVIKVLEAYRLKVHRTPQHMYAQLISPEDGQIVAAASTLEKEVRAGKTGNVVAASEVGKRIAERAQKAGVVKVAFDRAGFKYHGRVKALADAARAAGLEF